MKNKLTLRLEESLIKRAKRYAEERGTSVSQLVADYFAAIGEEKFEEEDQLPPITTSLSGILRDSDMSEKEYKSYLEDKYLK